MDDASHFLVIRLGPKTSECEKNVTVVSTVTGCDVTNCATTFHGFNKQRSSGIQLFCFSQAHKIGTNVCDPPLHRTPLDVDF